MFRLLSLRLRHEGWSARIRNRLGHRQTLTGRRLLLPPRLRQRRVLACGFDEPTNARIFEEAFVRLILRGLKSARANMSHQPDLIGVACLDIQAAINAINELADEAGVTPWEWLPPPRDAANCWGADDARRRRCQRARPRRGARGGRGLPPRPAVAARLPELDQRGAPDGVEDGTADLHGASLLTSRDVAWFTAAPATG